MGEDGGGLWRRHFHWSVLLRWEVLGWIVALLLAIAGLLLFFDQYLGANICFVLTAAFIVAKVLHAAITASDPLRRRATFAFVLCGLVGLFTVLTVRGVSHWARSKENSSSVGIRTEVAATDGHNESKQGDTNSQAPSTTETKTARPKPHPPRVKQWAVSTMIPIDRTHGIPDEDLRATPRDPLWLTYSDLSEMIRLNTKMVRDGGTIVEVGLSDDEIAPKLSKVLRYALLRWIAEIQNPTTKIDYRPGIGAKVNTPTAVPVPEAELYPKDKLERLLKDTEIGEQELQHHWFWEKEQFKFEVPKGTKVTLDENSLTFARNGDYTLHFSVELTGKNAGGAALPVGFHLYQQVQPSNLVGFLFAVKERMEWSGDYASADPYIDWATGLFDGLEKRLEQPAVP